jgi:hypothetical protein
VAWLGVALWQANPVRVGDGHEHVAVALAFARGHGPAFAPDQIPSLEAELRALGPSFSTSSLAHPDLVGRDGRQDMPHFWLYPLLAAPLVLVALLLGVSPLWGFVALHAVLFGLLAALILSRPAPVWTSLLLFSPFIWWLDKPSPDALLVACLAGAMLLWTTRPAVSLVLLGIGASQNPGLVLVAALFAAWGSIERPARLMCRRWQTGVLIAALLITLPAAYYLWRLGIPSPLTASTVTRWPGLFDALFPFTDVSVGLVFRFPPFVLAVVIAAGWLAWRELSRLREPLIATTSLAALALLWAVGQPVSQNHGGSPDLSRYALWLMPLALPLLQQAGTSTSAVMQRAGVALALVSAIWTVIAFPPSRHEGHLQPTTFAAWLWSRHPMWNDPRPEVFGERVSHAEPAVVPAATPDCQKVLLYEGQWPVHCLPQDTPPDGCFDTQRFCYANRTATGAGYLFMVEPLRPVFPIVQAEKTWTRQTPAVATMRQLVRGLAFGEPADALVSLRGLWHAAWIQQWSGPARSVFYVRNTRADARIGVRARQKVLARIIDLNRAVEIATYPIEPDTRHPESIPLPDAAPDLAITFEPR